MGPPDLVKHKELRFESSFFVNTLVDCIKKSNVHGLPFFLIMEISNVSQMLAKSSSEAIGCLPNIYFILLLQEVQARSLFM